MNKEKTAFEKGNVLLTRCFLFFIFAERGMTMIQYSYDGPVMEFNICVANRWKASTYAVSEQKARNNLAYQFKKKNNKVPGTKISLPGKIIVMQ